MSLKRQIFRYISCRGNYPFVYISVVFKNTKCVHIHWRPIGRKGLFKVIFQTSFKIQNNEFKTQDYEMLIAEDQHFLFLLVKQENRHLKIRGEHYVYVYMIFKLTYSV